jgi:lipopolysaccharide export system protein LptA
MRFTIERMRTLVLAAGVLLVVALAVFLALGKWKNLLGARDIPKRLGIDIEQEANGVTYTQSHAGHTLFRIHASRVEQLKNSHSLLHDVTIDLYGQDGRSVDRISGSDFEYNQQTGIATAAGKVEITLMRPGEALAISPKPRPNQAIARKAQGKPAASVAQSAGLGAIHVQTSGLRFDEKTRVASTSQHVEFSMARGHGSAMGASYDSQQGVLVLDHAVELTTARGSEPVTIRAGHAEFERGDQRCQLAEATADYRGGQATAGLAKVEFRDDGSAQRLDALNGFALSTATGGHLEAPQGTLQFDEHNQPRHGRLDGGVKIDSERAGRQLHGTASAAVLDFSPQGELRRVQLNQGVEMRSESQGMTAGAPTALLRVTRTWRSPVADVAFRNAGHGKVEPASIHGSGGVVVTTETRRGNAAAVPSRLAADQISGDFGPGSVLAAMTGVGHASIEQTTAQGARQTATGDRLEAHFQPVEDARPAASTRGAAAAGIQPAAAQIQSALLEGHVVLVQQPALKAGAQPQPPMRATAGRADYESGGDWLHLTESPRIEDGGLELTAQKVDISQQSGEAFARSDVKATWMSGPAPETDKRTGSEARAANEDVPTLGGQGPAHAIADEAQFNQHGGEATFRGRARVWQQANSIAAPLIVLNRQRQTLIARSSNPAEPVRVVLLSADAPVTVTQPAIEPVRATHGEPARREKTPSVIRVRGSEFTYSGAEHKAVMAAGALGPVVAETGGATCTANEVVLLLRPRADRAANERAQGQVERMTASGQVVLSSEGRRGTGTQLVYTGATGDYVLTGTTSAPPRLTDPGRGTVTGEALIFNSRDDSVSIEGGGRETRTDTTAPR